MARLSSEEIRAKLGALKGWEFNGDAIRKQFQFKDFMDAIAFVNRVAEIAEAADHHPDILINYRRVTFTCSTHTEHGVTDKDLRLAENIEMAFEAA